MTDQKTAALLACARAYFARGADLQYDQYSMDRVLQLTPRRRIYQPPEAATKQNILYLDCSGFIHAAYYNTFGVPLSASLTWHMIDFVKPRIYYCELTHEETEKELRERQAQIRALLRPGDVITFELHLGNGHTMMVLNDREYIHCSQRGHMGSYDYSKRKNRHTATGGMWIDSLEDLFAPLDDGKERNFLFSKRVKRFSIARPMMNLGEPTAEALLRLNYCTGLYCGVTVSHPGGRQAAPGETVTYRAFAENRTTRLQEAAITFAPPAGVSSLSPGEVRALLRPGETLEKEILIRVDTGGELWLEPPEIRVNGMRIYSPRVLLRQSAQVLDTEALLRQASQEIRSGVPALDAIADAYLAQDVVMEREAQQYAVSCFHQFDAVAGCVLARRTQQPRKDLAVYGMFGGYGVITPEMAYREGDRTTRISLSDLEIGDVIWCSDNCFGSGAYVCLFTGDSLIGSFENGGAARTLSGAEMEEYLDSLFGRFVFLLLRPRQGKQ